MNVKISRFLKAYSNDVWTINQLLVSTFVDANGYCVPTGNFLNKYVGCDKAIVNSFKNIIYDINGSFSYENLIELFEFVVSPATKVVTGSVYTPRLIREFIIERTLQSFDVNSWPTLKVADISCGCGGFFFSLIIYIRSRIDITCRDIIRSIIYGVDIEKYSVERTKILLSLYALSQGENLVDEDFNLYVANSLNKSFWTSGSMKGMRFDAIIGNPPYVTASKIEPETRNLLSEWTVTKSGKSDLYIPFFQVALESLTEKGVLGYITVSNFYRSLNGRSLREYFSSKEYDISLYDFGVEQIFKGCSTYTCLCFITKSHLPGVTYSVVSSERLSSISSMESSHHSYSQLDNQNGWHLQDQATVEFINKVEGTGTQLHKVVDIKNGIATLRNSVYVLNVTGETESEYMHEHEGKIYRIEKNVCRNVVKPSMLDYQEPIEPQYLKIIFPYQICTGKYQVYSEQEMKSLFPHTYEYLWANKSILARRDKGNRSYETWFAYGRTQALNMYGYRLFMPYISDVPKFGLSCEKTLLFYNGFAIVDDDIEKLSIIKKVLTSKIFWRYVKAVSKPYGGGFFSLGKRYIKHFGIPNFTSEEKEQLLAMTDQDVIDSWLSRFYSLSNVLE